MARTPRLPERRRSVAFELALRDDIGLADQARPKAAGLHLMTKGRGGQPELGGSLSERHHGSLLGGHQVLRGVVGDPSSFEVGVRGTQSPGCLDPVPEWSARDQGCQSDLGHDPGAWANTPRTSDAALLLLQSRRRDPCAERVAIELERRRTPAEVDRIAHSQADSLASVINTVLDGIGLTPEQRDRGIEIAITELRRATGDDPPWAG